GLAGERRREPFGGARRERRIGKVGPVRALAVAEKHHAVAPLLERVSPGQPVDAEIGDTFGEEPGIVLGGAKRRPPLAEPDGAEAAAVAAAQGQARSIESDLLAGSDAIGKTAFDLAQRDRRGRENAALRGAPGKLGHRQKRLTGKG